MTVVRKFRPDTKLKVMLANKGGIRVREALERAQSNLDEIRDECLNALDVKLQEIAACRNDVLQRERCYRLSNEIFAEAGAFGLTELSDAAHSLCVLLGADAVSSEQKAINVHLDAMRALRRPNVAKNAALRGAVIAELRVLTVRLSKEDAAAVGNA
jgi:hypothetical protein